MNSKYFKILNISENSSRKQVTDAYETKISELNRILENENSNKDDINNKILEINAAYDYLINNFFQNNLNSISLSRVKELINLNNLDEARDMLWKFSDRNAEWNYLMGQIYFKEGWYDKSQNHFKIAYDLEPNNFEYSQAYNSFNKSNNQFRQTYSKRTQMDAGGGCCDSCCTLLCIDSCCECFGCDFISCC